MTTTWTPAPEPADAAEPLPLADAVAQAIDMLDREEHRYVERFAPCPNGCVYEYDTSTAEGCLKQVAGPDNCDVCVDGTIEDEDAPWVTPLLERLREAVTALQQTAKPLLP